MRISREHWDELVAHAREEAPNECCDYMRAKEGRVEEVVRARNERASPYGYELDPRTLLEAFNSSQDGYQVAMYHSHPRSAPRPSEQDINLATYPEYLYVIVSLEGGEPAIRAWRIEDGRVDEEELQLQG